MNRLLPAINIFLSSVIEYYKQNTAPQLTRTHVLHPFERFYAAQPLFWLNIFINMKK